MVNSKLLVIVYYGLLFYATKKYISNCNSVGKKYIYHITSERSKVWPFLLRIDISKFTRFSLNVANSRLLVIVYYGLLFYSTKKYISNCNSVGKKYIYHIITERSNVWPFLLRIDKSKFTRFSLNMANSRLLVIVYYGLLFYATKKYISNCKSVGKKYIYHIVSERSKVWPSLLRIDKSKFTRFSLNMANSRLLVIVYYGLLFYSTKKYISNCNSVWKKYF
jgi:hypothetical protein